MIFLTFAAAIMDAQERFQRSHVVNTGHWQGVDIKMKPEMATYEVLNWSCKVPLANKANPHLDAFLPHWRDDIKPNLPWADDHFEERVCGQPINPGKTWEWWPYAKSASGHLDNGGKFNHNYMERYWPKYAGWDKPTYVVDDYPEPPYLHPKVLRNRGIYHSVGDLDDVVALLVREPTTRQAYLPVFFPEDTGAVHGGRIPCSLGYHFIQRGGYAHIVYYLRSCDFVRHFRDDIYLTLRLLLWVIERCAEQSEVWKEVKPGMFTMHITSLHMFRNDYINLFGGER
jgi:thymidylate synthase